MRNTMTNNARSRQQRRQRRKQQPISVNKRRSFGRLRFEPGAFEHDVFVYRQPKGGRVLVSSEPVERKGYACVLQKGDPVIAVHVPGPFDPTPCHEPLDHAACGEAFAMADAYYRGAGVPMNAYTIDSWFFDPSLQDLLPHASNLRQFVFEWLVHPIADTSDADFYERVLRTAPGDIERAGLNTSLQRAVAERIRAGHRFKKHGGIILADELRWGHQVYQQPGKVIDA